MENRTQYTDTFKTKADADQALDFLRTQVDFECGRVLDHSRRGEGFMVQAIFPDYGELNMIGCRRVLCPESFLRLLGGSRG